jgi:hypothetical protein
MSGTLFPEWVAAHQEQIDEYNALPERMKKMHKAFGRAGQGVTCNTCKFLVKWRYRTRAYFKCSLTTITHGSATDWRTSWPACGRHETTRT